MQTMPNAAGSHRGRSASMGTLLALGAGLALYQMTSLVLGTGGSRQLPLSLNIPAMDVEELPQPAASNADPIIGALAAASGPQVGSPAPSHLAATTPQPRTGSSAVVAAEPTTSPVEVPAAGPGRKPTPHPSPRPTPPGQPDPDRDRA